MSTSRKGKKHFTVAQAKEMRSLYESGNMSSLELAMLFGVAESTILSIVRYQTYVEETSPPDQSEDAIREWLKTRAVTYNITLDKLLDLIIKAEGKCQLCDNPLFIGKKMRGLAPSDCLCVDHNHTTNEGRGILCVPCNWRLGKIENQLTPKIRSYLSMDKSL